MAEPVRNDADLSALAAAIGPQLLIRMTALIRTAHTYDASNQTFQRQMTELFAVANRFKES